MRLVAASLACLAVIGTACLHPVAQLVGDGGDAGIACDWRDAGDAGICTDDSQCPDNYYCDYTVTACPNGLSTMNPGSCLPACPITASLPEIQGTNTQGAPCYVGEDSAPEETCFCDATGTVQQPCNDGRCALISGGVDPCIPVAYDGGYSGCQVIQTPHTPWTACVCPGNTCSVPQPDAGNGTCSYEINPSPIDFNLTSCNEVRVPVVITDVGSGDCSLLISVGLGHDGGGSSLVGVATSTSSDISPAGGPHPNSLTVYLYFDCGLVDGGTSTYGLYLFADGGAIPVTATCSCADGG